MKVYQTTFKKKNGESRNITFVRPIAEKSDADSAFLDTNVRSGSRSLPENMECVWDVEKQEFRTINHGQLEKPMIHVGNAVYNPTTNTFIW